MTANLRESLPVSYRLEEHPQLNHVFWFEKVTAIQFESTKAESLDNPRHSNGILRRNQNEKIDAFGESGSAMKGQGIAADEKAFL